MMYNPQFEVQMLEAQLWATKHHLVHQFEAAIQEKNGPEYRRLKVALFELSMEYARRGLAITQVIREADTKAKAAEEDTTWMLR